MAHTAHRDQRMMEEIEISTEELQRLAEETARLIREARHVVVFTGAGISTSAGIPDYRGPQGVWTLAAQNRTRDAPTTQMSAAIPTPTHMALVELQRRGKLHQVISQNVDGLHRKSGIPAAAMSELHGNTNVEECASCGKLHARDIHIHGDHQHFTGRRCSAEGCDGKLRDTIINFGENLAAVVLEQAFAHSERASVHICLGSSLTVSPACDLPRKTKQSGGKVVVCNLQRTPLDADCCDVRVHARCDDFMIRVMACLGWPIPAFVLQREVTLRREVMGGAPHVRVCAAYPTTDIPMTVFAKITATEGSGRSLVKDYSVDASAMNDIAPVFPFESSAQDFHVVGESFGYYREPLMRLTLAGGCNEMTVDAMYQPGVDAEWRITRREAAATIDLRKGSGARRVDGIKDSRGIDYTGWFAVTPIMDCPHTHAVRFTEGMLFDVNTPCGTCGNVGENMMCLSCGAVECGRHVNGHMLQHREATQHPMVAGFKDLSLWCYECEAYLEPRNPRLAPFYRLLHRAKFQEDTPAELVTAAAAPASTTQRKRDRQAPDDTVADASVAPLPPSFGPPTTDTTDNGWMASIRSAISYVTGGAPATSAATDSSSGGAPPLPRVTATSRTTTLPAEEVAGGFEIQPLRNCPHCSLVLPIDQLPSAPNTNAPCGTCGNVGENMVCLSCGAVECGRHVNGHMLQHRERTGHHMVCGFADLSFWCYSCENYVSERNRFLTPHYDALCLAKFGGQ